MVPTFVSSLSNPNLNVVADLATERLTIRMGSVMLEMNKGAIDYYGAC